VSERKLVCFKLLHLRVRVDGYVTSWLKARRQQSARREMIQHDVTKFVQHDKNLDAKSEHLDKLIKDW